MKYLFYGLEYTIIKQEINKLKKEFNIEDINVSYYDLNKDSLKNIIDDAKTISMFSDKKMIIVDNANIFTTISNEIEHDTEILSDYLKEDNKDTVLIFIVNYDKLDERKKITKLITNKKEFNKIDIDLLIKDKVKGYKIEKDAINKLKEYSLNNTGILLNELEKLMMYKINEKEITVADVISVVTKYIDLDIFKLIDNIVNKNKKDAIIQYREMLLYGEEPIKIVITLANQFRLMYQVKEYSKKGLSESEIASKLKVHPYRVKLAKEKAKSYKSEQLLSYLSKLADIDYQIKNGSIEKEPALEIFIMEV